MAISDVFDWIGNNASWLGPVVTGVGGAIVGSNANSKAAELSKEGLNQAAEIQAAGIDKALGVDLDTLVLLRQVFGDRFNDVVNLLSQAPANYRQNIAQGLQQYAGETTGAAQGYAGDLNRTMRGTSGRLEVGADDYNQNLEKIASTLGISVDQLVGGLDANAEKSAAHLAPYEAGGAEALNLLRQTAGSDPSQLTLAQQKQLDQLKRSAASRLAASGLRGAGRAGVATLNEADSDFRAAAEKANQDRVDRAIRALFSTGSGAAGNLAGLQERVGTQGFNAGLSTADKIAALGEKGAGADFDIAKAIAALNQGTGEKIASNNLTTRNDIAAKNLAATGSYADKVYSTDQALARETGDYYDRNASLVSGEGQSRSRAARETAGARAAARQGTSVIDANAGLANANLWTGAAGALAGVFSRPRQVPAAATAP